MRIASLTLVFGALALSGCSGPYVAKSGTPTSEVSSTVDAAQTAKEARVEAETAAAAKAKEENEAAWKKAQEDHVATLSPKRATWFRGVLAKPRVTIGMTEAEVKLLIHWSVDAKIAVSAADRTDARKVGEVAVWSNVPLAGPSGGSHEGPLVVTFRNGKVVSVETPRG